MKGGPKDRVTLQITLLSIEKQVKNIITMLLNSKYLKESQNLWEIFKGFCFMIWVEEVITHFIINLQI